MSEPRSGGRRARRLTGAVAPHLTRQNGVMVLASLAILVMIVFTQQARPATEFDSNAFAPSFKVTGELGKPTELRIGTVTLSNLRLARALRDGSSLGGGKTLDTPGIWVLVDYRFVGAKKSEALGVKLVTIDHTTYRASRRAGGSDTIVGEPGFTERGTLVFEVPKDALAGSSVTIGADSPFGDALWDTKAVISLELDDAEAARLVQRAPATVTVKAR